MNRSISFERVEKFKCLVSSGLGLGCLYIYGWYSEKYYNETLTLLKFSNLVISFELEELGRIRLLALRSRLSSVEGDSSGSWDV